MKPAKSRAERAEQTPADSSVSPKPTGGLESNIVAHFGKGILESAVYGGNILCDIRFDDGAVAESNETLHD